MGLGIAGALQRNRKRMFAVLGVAAIHSQAGLGDLVSLVATGLTKDQPKVHEVSPGDE